MPNDEKPQEAETPAGGRNTLLRFIPWLIVLALAVLFVPLYLTSSTLDNLSEPLATEAVSLEQTMTAPPRVPAAEQTLSAQLLDVAAQLQALESIPPTMIAGHVDWPAIMSTIHSYDADQIRLTGFNHSPGSLTLQGQALQESSVIDYAHALEQTGLFSQVHVQSITVNPVPPATPDQKATPTGSPVLTETYMPVIFTVAISLNEAGNGSK